MIPDPDRIQTTSDPSLENLPIDFNDIRREAYASVEYQDDARIRADCIDAIEAFEQYTGHYLLSQGLEAVFTEESFPSARFQSMPLDIPGVSASITRIVDNGTELPADKYTTNRRKHTGALAVYPVECWSGGVVRVEVNAGVAPGGNLPGGMQNALGVWTRYRATGEPRDLVLFYMLLERYTI